MISFLSDYFEIEKSSLIKQSLKDLYEDIIDRKVIDEFELEVKETQPQFISADELLKSLELGKAA